MARTYVLGSRRKKEFHKLEVGQRFMRAYDEMKSASPRGGAAAALQRFREAELEWTKVNGYPEPKWVEQEKILAAQRERKAREEARRIQEYESNRKRKEREGKRKKSSRRTVRIKFRKGME